MKTFLTLFVLFFSSSVFADVGDTYFCETKIKAKLNIENIDSYEDEYFHFYWKNNRVETDEEFSGGYMGADIIWSDGRYEFFYAVDYFINSKGIKIPLNILIYKDEILSIFMSQVEHKHQIYSSSCKKL